MSGKALQLHICATWRKCIGRFIKKNEQYRTYRLKEDYRESQSSRYFIASQIGSLMMKNDDN